MLETDQSAPQFTLQDAAQETRSLAEILSNGPAVFCFVKVSCPVCQFTVPFLERLREGGKLQFFAISQDGAAETNGFMAEYAPGMTALLDDTDRYEVSNAFGITNVPSTFLVEPDGRISSAMDGFSKLDLESLGERAGAAPFRDGEYVPEWKAG